MEIPEFVKLLATAVPALHSTNPYAGDGKYASQRRQNLQSYLQLMVQQQPRLLLVGEAPGYRGCRLTGVPFTSPQLLTRLDSRFCLPTNPFHFVNEWKGVDREASATIVWRTIEKWRPLPLLWNIYPFHPHQPDKPQTNRTPKTSEIEAGRPFLKGLRQIFPQTIVVAVGKKAATALAKWEIAHTAVRHPAHGGANTFRIQLEKLQ